MKIVYMLLAALMLSLESFSQQQVIHLWPGKVPGEKDAKHPATITPDGSNHVQRLTDVTDPILTVFKPAGNSNLHAGVIICPGGGYQILAIDLEGYEIAQWLNSLGITAFVLQYRVPGKEAGALQDVQRAMRLVRSHAAEWNIDAGKIGVLGFSAGGSLSARISTLYGQSWYDPQDAADSASSRPDFTVLIYPAYLDKGPGNSLTPELKMDENTPPMFLFQAADDPYGNSSLVMASALRNAKVPVEFHLYPHGGHGYGLRPGNPSAEAWPGLAAKWLEKQLNAEK